MLLGAVQITMLYRMVKHRKVNLRAKVADLQLHKLESVAFLVKYQNRELELTSEAIKVADTDTDADTVILGVRDKVGNLNNFHDDQ